MIEFKNGSKIYFIETINGKRGNGRYIPLENIEESCMNKTPMEEVATLNKINKDRKIELGKEYWISEWSWNPICDGYGAYPETIRYEQEIDGYKVYTTGKNYRHYFAWDICDTEDEAHEISDLKNSYSYDWNKVENSLIDRNKIINTPENERPLEFEEIEFENLSKYKNLKIKMEDIPRFIAELGKYTKGD